MSHHSLAVRTLASHAENQGSSPCGGAKRSGQSIRLSASFFLTPPVSDRRPLWCGTFSYIRFASYIALQLYSAYAELYYATRSLRRAWEFSFAETTHNA